MNYALKTLIDERNVLLKCLKGFDKNKYSEAFKNRNKRLKELNNAIQLINK